MRYELAHPGQWTRFRARWTEPKKFPSAGNEEKVFQLRMRSNWIDSDSTIAMRPPRVRQWNVPDSLGDPLVLPMPPPRASAHRYTTIREPIDIHACRSHIHLHHASGEDWHSATTITILQKHTVSAFTGPWIRIRGTHDTGEYTRTVQWTSSTKEQGYV